MSKVKKEIIHRSKLFGGVKTAEEIHAEIGWRGHKCEMCSNTPVICVRMFMEHDEFVSRCPEMAAAIAASNTQGPYIPTVAMTFGKMVKYTTVYACRHHQLDLEREAAKAPSFVLVEIDRGPGSDKPFIQVPAA